MICNHSIVVKLELILCHGATTIILKKAKTIILRQQQTKLGNQTF